MARTSIIVAAALAAIANVSLSAGVFLDPGFTGTTQYSEWDTFTFANTIVSPLPNLPDVAGDTGQIFQSNPALITTGGNIYSFAGPLSFTLTGDSSYFLGQISLQVRALGQDAPVTSVFLELDDGTQLSPTTTSIRMGDEFDSGFGDSADTAYAFLWDLTGLTVDTYQLKWEQVVHSSLDEVRVDTTDEPFAADPIPPTIAFCAMSSSGYEIHFDTINGQTYQVYATTDFQEWTLVGDPILGDGSIALIVDIEANSFSNRFYRILSAVD